MDPDRSSSVATSGTMAAADGDEPCCPLKCLVCHEDMRHPVRLPCQHCFCRDCLPESTRACPICGRALKGSPTDLPEDSVISYLLDSSKETVEVCANCDVNILPMFFCENCQIPLCAECQVATHKAKIFATHHIVDLEETGRERGQTVCSVHGEPFILFCLDQRKLMCVECFNSSSIDKRHDFVKVEDAYKICRRKIEKEANKLKGFQSDLREHIDGTRRVLNEIGANYEATRASVERKCDELVAKIVRIKDELISSMNDEQAGKEAELQGCLSDARNLMFPVDLNLLCASVFCSSASKLDLLHCYGEMMKGMITITSSTIAPVTFSAEFVANYQDQFMRNVEKAFGWQSTLITPSQAPKAQAAVAPTLHEKSKLSSPGIADYVSWNPKDGAKASFTGSGMSSIAGLFRTPPQQLVGDVVLQADLNGIFGEHYQRIEVPLKQLAAELAALSKSLIEIQRDITMRRCIVRPVDMEVIIMKCDNFRTKTFDHATTVKNLQPVVRDLWQEQLDRVRRQQGMFQQKMQEVSILQDFARRAQYTANTLKPFAFYMASVISVTDNRRTTTVELAPMERICAEICNIAPDSQHRVDAIEKEEEARRQQLEQARAEEQRLVREAKQNLKVTVQPRSRRTSSSSNTPVVENNRDRLGFSSNVVTRASFKRQKASHRTLSADESSLARLSECLLANQAKLAGGSLALSPTSSATSPVPPALDEGSEGELSESTEEKTKETEIQGESKLQVSPVGIPPPPPPPPPGFAFRMKASSVDDLVPPPTMSSTSSSTTSSTSTLKSVPCDVKRLLSGSLAGIGFTEEAVKAREELMEAIKERFKKVNARSDRSPSVVRSSEDLHIRSDNEAN